MSRKINIALAQLNLTVGDLQGNTRLMIDAIGQARDQQQADVIIFPELSISGYPPEDLLFRPAFIRKVKDGIDEIAKHCDGITAVIGAPIHKKGRLYNQALVLQNGQVLAQYSKQKLPNYRVFDEKRYFKAGREACVVEVKGIKLGLLICEDIWRNAPAKAAKEAGADMLCVLNASPFRLGKSDERHELLVKKAQQYETPIAYVNLIGGQDELVFDGDSCLYDRTGQLLYQAPLFESGVFNYELLVDQAGDAILPREIDDDPLIYQALVMGVRDYVNKNGFPGVLFGLSGGIDSALVAAIAVDALGADRVEAVMMPFRYTSSMSIEDARKEAEALGIRYREMPIEPIYESFMSSLEQEFEGTQKDATEENIQARTRGVLLMAMSNKLGKMLLATSNKSEMSVGYATLYGDMSGGFSPLKDVSKLRVYALARYRNTIGDQPVIPQRVIDRPPSAELAPDQKDQDSLPPYEVLDPILQAFIEEYQCVEDIVAQGYDEATVRRVINLVLVNEYKRRQGAPGVRISQRAFGKDRRYPITSAYRKQL